MFFSFCLTWEYYRPTQIKNLAPSSASSSHQTLSIPMPKYFRMYLLPYSYCHCVSSDSFSLNLLELFFLLAFLTSRPIPPFPLTPTTIRIIFIQCNPTQPLQCLSSIFKLKPNSHYMVPAHLSASSHKITVLSVFLKHHMASCAGGFVYAASTWTGFPLTGQISSPPSRCMLRVGHLGGLVG